ncbi:growth arrest and DNA damage-inducible proteins-interacting protein 1 [Alosa sapidissima]|uniref:growth arrest and DNA damage-inducible proteins-interacting protein 1 n=1 Tax=Alosa sapidissima TaxID=34773 RepID=UPI001C09C003|nr:growth arrest and DNA damage-inducible proteins-interacting protein 1 [Alosa sapidissima]
MAASVLGRRTALFTEAIYFSLNAFAPRICSCGVLQHIASYHAKPFKRNINEPYIPDKQNEKTPVWQKTAKYDRKLFGRYGSASGINPATLWPSPKQLDEIIAEEKQWHPSLEEMLQNVSAKDKELADKRAAREKLIAANMAKMPQMVANWRRETREAKEKKKEEKAKRDRLLAEARERFGYAMDPRSPKFQDMIKDIEKEEKKKRKLLKRRKREEEQGQGTPGAEGASGTAAS